MDAMNANGAGVLTDVAGSLDAAVTRRLAEDHPRENSYALARRFEAETGRPIHHFTILSLLGRLARKGGRPRGSTNKAKWAGRRDYAPPLRHVPSSPVRRELAAMDDVAAVLDGIEPAAAVRVARWAAERYAGEAV